MENKIPEKALELGYEDMVSPVNSLSKQTL